MSFTAIGSPAIGERICAPGEQAGRLRGPVPASCWGVGVQHSPARLPVQQRFHVGFGRDGLRGQGPGRLADRKLMQRLAHRRRSAPFSPPPPPPPPPPLARAPGSRHVVSFPFRRRSSLAAVLHTVFCTLGRDHGAQSSDITSEGSGKGRAFNDVAGSVRAAAARRGRARSLAALALVPAVALAPTIAAAQGPTDRRPPTPTCPRRWRARRWRARTSAPHPRRAVDDRVGRGHARRRTARPSTAINKGVIAPQIQFEVRLLHPLNSERPLIPGRLRRLLRRHQHP